MSIEEAFFRVCEDAKPSDSHYVSLYVRSPYYGGPEEGGWWGTDVHLIATQEYASKGAAKAALKSVETLAEQLSTEARRDYGEHCLRSMEWLEARGLDADYLPEPDGELSYFVTIEDQPGSSESRGCRHYE